MVNYLFENLSVLVKLELAAQFERGHLKDILKIKNVVKKLTYEYGKCMLPDPNRSIKLTILKITFKK